MKLEPDKKLHSREHVLAQDLSEMLGEPKKFAAYLGIAKRYYERDLRALARTVCEKSNLPAEALGKYFFACLKGLAFTSEFLVAQRHKKQKRNARNKRNKKNATYIVNYKRTAPRVKKKSA